MHSNRQAVNQQRTLKCHAAMAIQRKCRPSHVFLDYLYKQDAYNIVLQQ